MIRLVLVTLCSICCAGRLAAADRSIEPMESFDQADVEFFETKIRPVLAEHCYSCHAADSKKVQGGLLLDNRAGVAAGGESGPVVVPGKPEESELIAALRYESFEMPPAGRLPEAVVKDFEEWIRRGAPDPRDGVATKKARVLFAEEDAKRHWAFQPLAKVAPPAANNPWIRTPIDAFVLAKLRGAGLAPSAEADRRTLLRRASYDLLGLPPTYEDVQAFTAATSDAAWEREIDRLLDSPHYGERYARHWLDLARYADNNGERLAATKGAPYYPFAWTYRDYVVNAFNNDLPYNRFVLEQLAGDQLTDDPQAAAGVGFLRVGKAFGQNPHNRIDDRIDALSKTFLGLSVACARCHDHKFDPIPTADYYALHGVLMSSEDVDVVLNDTAGTPENADYTAAATKLVEDVRTDVRRKLNEYCSGFTKQTAAYLTGAQSFRDGKLKAAQAATAARESDLAPNMFGAWVDALERLHKNDDPAFRPWFAFAALDEPNFAVDGPTLADRVASGSLDGRDVHPLVARAFAEQQPRSLRDVAEIYQALFLEVERKADGRYPVAEWMTLVDKVPVKTSRKELEIAGLPPPLDDPQWESLRKIVVGFDGPFGIQPRSLTNGGAGDLRARLVMARHAAVKFSGEHPGAPKKAMSLADVNSPADSHVFIRGDSRNLGPRVPRRYLSLVSSTPPEPFTRGSGRYELAEAIASPRNPLTARVIVNRVWQWHFGSGLVATPSDFGLRGTPPTHPELLDWMAGWFIEHDWSIKRLNRLIMTSSVYRQSGLLRSEGTETDPQNLLYWRFPPRRLEFEELRDTLLTVSGKLQPTVGGRPVDAEQDASRRTLYLYVDRLELPDVFRVFDFADPEFTTAERESTIVPQQALYLMNHAWPAARAEELAGRTAATTDEASQVTRMYRLVFQRDPEAAELKTATEFLKATIGNPQRMRHFAQALFQTNELMQVE